METAEHLNSRIRLAYNALDDAGVVAVSPADPASAVFKQIDPRKASPPLVEIAAILALRQRARAICRQRQADGERVAEESGLFEFQLQQRYPASRAIAGESDGVYVLRAHLTLKERLRNVERLRSEARAKIAHADALLAETDLLVRAGEIAAEKEGEHAAGGRT